MDRVAREIGVVGVRECAVTAQRLDRGRRHGQVAVEHKPRLDVRVPSPKREGELVHVTTDSPLGRPRVLERLDVEEKPDRVISRLSWSL